jgi:hypothetical protein
LALTETEINPDLRAQSTIRWAVEVSSKIFDGVDVTAYGIFRKVTTLELFQHHFAKSGHEECLLVTRQLISTVRQPPLHYLTRAVSAAQAASF